MRKIEKNDGVLQPDYHYNVAGGGADLHLYLTGSLSYLSEGAHIVSVNKRCLRRLL